MYYRDIYNITAAIARAQRQNKSPPQAFIDILNTEKAAGNVYFKWRADQSRYIAIFFIADMRSVRYLNQYPDILLLDCTYKTNKFDIPLLYVRCILVRPTDRLIGTQCGGSPQGRCYYVVQIKATG